MIKTALIAAIALLCAASNAEARHRHAAAGNGLSPDCQQNGGPLPCELPVDLRKPIPLGSRIVITMHRDRRAAAPGRPAVQNRPRELASTIEPVQLPGIVRSVSGAVAHVAHSATAAFQCLVDSLDRVGYRIAFMGGYRAHGSVLHSKHPLGGALDINQTARNRVTRPFPAGFEGMAESCNLTSGSTWRWADTGHFEVRESYASLAGDRPHRRRYASR